MQYNQTQKIQEHYDFVSPYYRKLWGRHLHHGYFETGNETRSEATMKLIQYLVRRASVQEGARVLDIGCGFGGSSIWLAETLNCDVTGVTISPLQVEMATKAAEGLGGKVRFLCDDANDLQVEGEFDVVWAVEMISHLNKRDDFFKKVSSLLVPGGKMCIAAWMKDEILNNRQQGIIDDIEQGMLVDLPTMSEYSKHFSDNCLRLVHYQDISHEVAKTWDICLDIIKDKALWRLALEHGREFISYLKSFRAMRMGFKTGAFRYSAIVVEKV